MIRRTALIVACVVLAATAACLKPSSGTGSSVPAVKVKDLAGKDFDLASTRGKVLLINFWATWCAPCKHEIPDLARLHEKYKSRDFAVLGFTVDSGSSAEIAPFIPEFGINYPVFIADDVRSQFYSEPGIPMTIVVNRRGQIVEKLFGTQSAEQFEAAIAPLLKEGA